MDDQTLAAIVGRFMHAHEAGERPDLDAYLAEAGDAADDLLAILEAYLLRTPGRLDLDEVERFAGSPAAQPTFGAVLRAAREDRGVLRRDLIDRLVGALGLPEAARDRVDQRLHEVEAGSRSAAGVSERLIDALEAIIGGVASGLRAARAASATFSPGSNAGATAFSRATAEPGSWPAAPALPDADQPGLADALAGEIDALFGAGA